MRGMGRGVREFKDAMENPAAGDEKTGKSRPRRRNPGKKPPKKTK